MRLLISCALLLAVVASVACKTMKTVTLDQLDALRPDRAWVTQSDKSVVLLYDPKVVGDTVVGYVGRQRQGWPSGQLERLVVQQAAPARTALLAVGIATGLGGFFVAVAGSGTAQIQNATSGDCDKNPQNVGCNPQ